MLFNDRQTLRTASFVAFVVRILLSVLIQSRFLSTKYSDKKRLCVRTLNNIRTTNVTNNDNVLNILACQSCVRLSVQQTCGHQVHVTTSTTRSLQSGGIIVTIETVQLHYNIIDPPSNMGYVLIRGVTVPQTCSFFRRELWWLIFLFLLSIQGKCQDTCLIYMNNIIYNYIGHKLTEEIIYR